MNTMQSLKIATALLSCCGIFSQRLSTAVALRHHSYRPTHCHSRQLALILRRHVNERPQMIDSILSEDYAVARSCTYKQKRNVIQIYIMPSVRGALLMCVRTVGGRNPWHA